MLSYPRVVPWGVVANNMLYYPLCCVCPLFAPCCDLLLLAGAIFPVDRPLGHLVFIYVVFLRSAHWS